MAHPLEVKVASIGSRVRRQLALFGLSRVVAAFIGALIVLALADYLIRFEDRGIRLICSLAAATVLVWSAQRFLIAPLAHRFSDVAIAQRLERRFPHLNDLLSSSVQFLRESEDDPQAGSVALRRAVIVETTAKVEDLNLTEAVDPRPARRAAVLAAGVCLLAGILVASKPESARRALVRLALPFGSEAWPRANDLEFLDPPDRLALGQPFEVQLIDRNNRLPDEVRVYYRFEGENSEQTVEVLHPTNGAVFARRDKITRPFQYRAEAGDDRSMAWLSLDVVEPPRLESLTITLHPPAYTGWPVERSEKQIQALQGTRVEMTGTVNKPLVAARIVLQEDAEIRAALAVDRFGFTVGKSGESPFIVDRSGTYAFALTDTENITGGADDRWEIRAIEDMPPGVSIDQPAGNVFVTRDAVVDLRVGAKDDLAIHEVHLHFNRSDKTDVEDFRVPLFRGPDHVAPAANSVASGDTRVVHHEWDLAPLGLEPGTQINFYASASDYRPQMGRSPTRRLTIITRQQLDDRVSQRQALLLGELRRVLKMQQEARSQTTSLEIQLREVGRFGKPDVDHAQAAQMNQRQIARALTADTASVPAQIKELLAELTSNNVDNPDVVRRMNAILGEIDRLDKQHLSAIDRELTSAVKGAQAKLGSADRDPEKTSTDHEDFAQSLSTAGGHQEEVIRSLESMLGNLTQWDDYRRFSQDIAQIRGEQQQIQEQTRQLGNQTLGKELKDLDREQQAALKKLGNRQMELARRLDKAQQQMAAMSARLKAADPLAASTLAEAVEQATRAAIGGDMRQSAQHVEKNQLGQASGRQDQATRGLDELLDVLANRRENELGRLVKKLREAEQQLDRLRAQQEGLRKKIAAANQKADPEARKRELARLSKEQKQLQQEAQNMARRLERLQAQRASRAMAAACSKMGRAEQAASSGDCESCEQEVEKAQKDLDEASQQLAERRRQAEADLAHEQLARIEDNLKGLHKRQQNLVAETARVENLRSAQGQLRREQAASVQQQAREQKSLEQEVHFLAEKIAAAEVFHLALMRMAKDMARAAELLRQNDTGEVAQQAERNAETALARLLEALKKDPKAAGEGSDGQGGSGGNKGQNQQGIRALAELKLLKLLQQDLNDRFENLVHNQTDDPADQAAAYAELGREQGQLAALLVKLSAPADDAAPEELPEKLPVIREDEPSPDELLPGVGEGLPGPDLKVEE